MNAIESSRIMILVFSRNANASRQIKREVERADDKGVYTIPFRIDDIEPTKSLEYFISAAQWMDAFSPPLEPHLDVLTQAVATVLAGPPRTATTSNESNGPEITPAAAAGEQVSEPRPRTASERSAPLPSLRWIFSIAVAAMLVAVAAGWYFGRERSRPQKRVAPERTEEPSSLTKRARDADGLQVPERENPMPKVGARAASAPALLAKKKPPSAPTAEVPANVVRRYYGQMNERSVDQAHACLSRNFKTRLSRERFSNVCADTQTIVIKQLNEVSLGDAEAVLAIEFVEMDRDNHRHNWIRNIYLVKESETWRIDRTSLKSELLGEVMPNPVTSSGSAFLQLTTTMPMAAEDYKTFERKLSATNSQYKVAIFKAKNGKLALVLDTPTSEAAANALVSYSVPQGLSETAYAKLGYGWTPNQ